MYGKWLLAQVRNGSCFVTSSGFVWRSRGRASCELKDGLQETEEVLVVALKRFLAAQLSWDVRLKLLGGDGKVIADDAPLTGPADFTLVRMDFQSSEVATNAAFLHAKEVVRPKLNVCFVPLNTLMLEMLTTTLWASMRLPAMATRLSCDCC